MEIVVNGERRAAADGATVGSLLGELGVALSRVAVERNRAIVPKAEYARTALSDGDRIEIVSFVGGG